MSFGTQPEFDPLREQNMLDKAFLWAEKWFETSPYAPYLPYVLGALAMATRFWMSQRMMKSSAAKSKANAEQTGTATGTAPAPVAAAPTASGKGGATKRRGK